MGGTEVSELWPADFRVAVEDVFGGKGLNRTAYDIVNRRVEHAFGVWGQRFEMNPKQHEYAWAVLRSAVLQVKANQARIQPRNPYPYWRRAVAASMERVVNNEDAHAGFKRRAGLVDVAAQLEEAFA